MYAMPMVSESSDQIWAHIFVSQHTPVQRTWDKPLHHWSHSKAYCETCRIKNPGGVCEEVGQHITGGTVLNVSLTMTNDISNKIILNIDVMAIVSQVHGTYIIL